MHLAFVCRLFKKLIRCTKSETVVTLKLLSATKCIAKVTRKKED